ncbi:hypothetical protein [Janthinobacterium aquaticum]|uniref:hypothetical protein n=1 Tax=Janthinobacterium sp. FT58W TaxID=2654254 RepID=UPI00186AF126|nr:hypothetical protein [Janthinobacterium sp. FT58W]
MRRMIAASVARRIALKKNAAGSLVAPLQGHESGPGKPAALTSAVAGAAVALAGVRGPK